MKKYVFGIIGLAILLVPMVFFPFTHLDDGLKLFQVKQEKAEILILSRGFVAGNPHYVPENVTVRVGTMVRWTNGDMVHHTVTSDEGVQGKLKGQIFDSGPISPRSEFVLDTSRLLDDVYAYHCTIHPWARGTLTVVTEPVSVLTDKKIYDVGEQVVISGIASIPAVIEPTEKKKLVNATAPQTVFLQIFKSSGETFFSIDIPTTAGGKYSYILNVGEPDVYQVKVTLDDFSAGTIFEVQQLPREKIVISRIEVEDSSGRVISVAKLGEPVLLRAEIRNVLSISQDYTYIVQVKDSKQVTVFLEWKSRSIAPFGTSSPALTWTPEREDTYYVEIFVWKSMAIPEALSIHVAKTTFIVGK